MDMPTALAIQCVDETTPTVPTISGRVMNEGRLMGTGYSQMVVGRVV